MKGAEGIVCLEIHESVIMRSQDNKLQSVYLFTAAAFPMLCAVLLFGSLGRIANKCKS